MVQAPSLLCSPVYFLPSFLQCGSFKFTECLAGKDRLCLALLLAVWGGECFVCLFVCLFVVFCIEIWVKILSQLTDYVNMNHEYWFMEICCTCVRTHTILWPSSGYIDLKMLHLNIWRGFYTELRMPHLIRFLVFLFLFLFLFCFFFVFFFFFFEKGFMCLFMAGLEINL